MTTQTLTRISHRFLLNGCNLLVNKELWDSKKTVCLFGSVQQKPQTDKRARRRYRCDPLGHVHEHAPGARISLCLASHRFSNLSDIRAKVGPFKSVSLIVG